MFKSVYSSYFPFNLFQFLFLIIESASLKNILYSVYVSNAVASLLYLIKKMYFASMVFQSYFYIFFVN